MTQTPSSLLPLRRSEELAVQQVDDEVLLYDQRNHQAYCLNATSALVWKLCDGTRTVSKLAALVAPGIHPSAAEEVVRYSLVQLAKDDLITGYLQTELPVVSRRNMLARAGAGLTLLLPVIAIIAAPKAAQAYTGCIDC